MDKRNKRLTPCQPLRQTVLMTALTLVSLTFGGFSVVAQDRLKSMPGYEQYQKMSREIPGAVKPGAVAVRWIDGGKSFEFTREGRILRYDLATRTTSLA